MLKAVDLETTGKFRCEISGEAPLFQTAYKDAVMAVVGKFNLEYTSFFSFSISIYRLAISYNSK